MKLDIGLLAMFFLMGAVSSVIPIIGPLVAAPMASYRFLRKTNGSLTLYSYLAFMVGMGIVEWFLWLPLLWNLPDGTPNPMTKPTLIFFIFVVSLLFGIGHTESKNPDCSLF